MWSEERHLRIPRSRRQQRPTRRVWREPTLQEMGRSQRLPNVGFPQVNCCRSCTLLTRGALNGHRSAQSPAGHGRRVVRIGPICHSPGRWSGYFGRAAALPSTEKLARCQICAAIHVSGQLFSAHFDAVQSDVNHTGNPGWNGFLRPSAHVRSYPIVHFGGYNASTLTLSIRQFSRRSHCGLPLIGGWDVFGL
jgi:hypothetical protein